jgi:hypothetical protein
MQRGGDEGFGYEVDAECDGEGEEDHAVVDVDQVHHLHACQIGHVCDPEEDAADYD